MTNKCGNWQEEFVYIKFVDQRLKTRFFSNTDISREELLESISKATVEKMKRSDSEWILAVQDTTSVGFGDRKSIKGMGYYCSTEQKGMLLHTCIAVTDQGIPLGILYQETNTREHERMIPRQKNRRRPDQLRRRKASIGLKQ